MKYTDAVQLGQNGLLQKLQGEIFEVREEFFWYLDYQKKNPFVIVPEGFQTNFGSIPRIMRVFFTPTKYLGYILHDYLYSWSWKIIYQDDDEYSEVQYTRKEADLILRNCLKVEGAWFLERNMIYLWVRIWWFLHYESQSERK